MTIEIITEQDPEEMVPGSTPVPTSWWGKVLYGLFIVVTPILAFWATELFKPEWQSGKVSDYLVLLLFPEASLIFFLLLAYSVTCYCLLLIDVIRYSQKHFVRFGIYTGVLLALQYSILSGLFFFNDSNNLLSSLYLIGLWILPVFLPKLYSILINKWGVKAVNLALLILVAATLLISALATRSPLFPFAFVLAGVTLAAPFWCFLMAFRAAIWLFKKYEFKLTLPRSLGLATWIAGYVAAWRFDILKMYKLYAELPPQPPPDCYIATAAARGHPRFVGSWMVKCPNGETIQVNKQLQILKCAELALMAVQPRFHKTLRRAYDVLGKSLAKRMQNPFLADAVYLLLQPWGWLAGSVLRVIVPEIDFISNKMYVN